MLKKLFKRQSPAQTIALGFILAIFIGSGLLMLPISVRDTVKLRYIDALYTSASAVCVTGLVTVDAYDTFTAFGQIVLGLLIQIGGLGVTTVGAAIILAMGKKIDLKGRNIIHESMNFDSGRSTRKFILDVVLTTVVIEFAGAALSFMVFIQDFPFWRAVGISLFHSIASFNNAGFDIMGGFQSLVAYQDNIFLNLVTVCLIFFGGIGFLVIREMRTKKFHLKKYSMHAKVVLTMSAALLVTGTLMLKLAEGSNISWLGAFFSSFSARTAGIATYPLSNFTNAGLLVVIVLMYIGASPGSTGGGIKTSTFFVILQGIKSAATNKSEKAFKYSIPKDAFKKASVIAILAISIILGSTLIICLIEPDLALVDVLFEMTSAFATVGFSTGITTNLSVASKITSIFVMYAGRLGPLTVASLWYFSRGESVSYPEGNIAIG